MNNRWQAHFESLSIVFYDRFAAGSPPWARPDIRPRGGEHLCCTSGADSRRAEFIYWVMVAWGGDIPRVFPEASRYETR
jgi:hypothetical protein